MTLELLGAKDKDKDKGNDNDKYNAGDRDLFVVKYNSNGVKQWTKQLGTLYVDGGEGIAADAARGQCRQPKPSNVTDRPSLVHMLARNRVSCAESNTIFQRR